MNFEIWALNFIEKLCSSDPVKNFPRIFTVEILLEWMESFKKEIGIKEIRMRWNSKLFKRVLQIVAWARPMDGGSAILHRNLFALRILKDLSFHWLFGCSTDNVECWNVGADSQINGWKVYSRLSTALCSNQTVVEHFDWYNFNWEQSLSKTVVNLKVL